MAIIEILINHHERIFNIIGQSYFFSKDLKGLKENYGDFNVHFRHRGGIKHGGPKLTEATPVMNQRLLIHFFIF